MNDQGTKEPAFDVKQAQMCLDENRFGDALEMAETWLARVPEDVDAKIILSQGLLRLGKLDRLRGLLGEVDKKIGRLSLVYLRLGELCRQSGLNTEADNFLNKYNGLSAAICPDEKARLTDASGESEEADDTEREAADDIYPEFYTVTLADLYVRQGHPALARNVLEAILKKEPGNQQASMKLTELVKLLTVAGAVPEPTTVHREGGSPNAAIVSELEGWLAKVTRLRSPAS